jgi:hypothetical protein
MELAVVTVRKQIQDSNDCQQDSGYHQYLFELVYTWQAI